MEAVGGSGAGVIKNVDRGDCDRRVMVPFSIYKNEGREFGGFSQRETRKILCFAVSGMAVLSSLSITVGGNLC